MVSRNTRAYVNTTYLVRFGFHVIKMSLSVALYVYNCIAPSLLTLSAHAREGYSSRPVCLSVCLSRSDFGD